MSKIRLKILLRRFNLPADCTQKQLKKAFQEIAKQVHPDTNPEQGSAKLFTILKNDYNEINELLLAYPHSVRKQMDFSNSFGEKNNGSNGKSTSTSSYSEADLNMSYAEKVHRDPLLKHYWYQRELEPPPEVPLWKKVSVISAVLGTSGGLIVWAAAMSNGRVSRKKPPVEELDAAIAPGQKTDFGSMTKTISQSLRKETKDQDYYANRTKRGEGASSSYKKLLRNSGPQNYILAKYGRGSSSKEKSYYDEDVFIDKKHIDEGREVLKKQDSVKVIKLFQDGDDDGGKEGGQSKDENK